MKYLDPTSKTSKTKPIAGKRGENSEMHASDAADMEDATPSGALFRAEIHKKRARLQRILRMSILVCWSKAKTSPSNSLFRQVTQETTLPIVKHSPTCAIFEITLAATDAPSAECGRIRRRC
jgi:hypothetical protein